MSAQELLSRLEAMGVELVATDGRLKVSSARGALDETLRQSIAAHKAALIDLLARRSSASERIASIARGVDLPLSFFQERLWVLYQLDPRSTDYIMAAAWPAPEGATLIQVVAAVERTQARHESLHAVFVDDGSLPRARIAVAAPVATHDITALTTDAQQRWLTAELDRAVHTPIDLAAGPVVRFTVTAFGPGRHLVVLVAHHIALDAWSIGLLRAEVDASIAGTALPAPALHYADFAAWQRGSQDPVTIASELEWWTRALDGVPQLSAFPADRVVPAEVRGATVDFRWDVELSGALRELARTEGATVYMALLAACAGLLRAHTGQGTVVLGSPMGMRERPELETVVGPFVNLLLIRLDLGDDPSFVELLRRARHALLEAHGHRQVPFEMLLERLKPARSFDHGPLFQVAVVQHSATSRSDLLFRSGGAMHDLTWFVNEVDGHLTGSAEYRTDLYSPGTVEGFVRQLQQLLRGAVAHPTQPISELSLLDDAERHRVLQEFNATQLSLDTAPFIRQFERQVATAPARLALRYADDRIDYAELNRRANRLAQRLRAAGVAPGVHVAVCLDRTPDLVVALLAVQKSGGAYVPLDPAFPAERLAFMIADSGARVLLASSDIADDFDRPTGLELIDPRAESATQTEDVRDEGGRPGPSDPAYLIYTSGSTGQPKGVVVPHGALANFLGSMRHEPGLAADDIVAAVTTVSFDIAGLELYLPLTVGACIELVPRDTAADGAALAECLESCGATVLQATPTTWRLLLEAGWQPARPLRAFCGGEGLPRDLADALLGRVSGLWNLYGPTETTIWSTVERVLPSPAPITIGRPIANTQVYVLNAARQAVPVGVAGEIWIGGQGLALGYHNRPELTAERFVTEASPTAAGARLYRTGDLGRWDASGKLHHLGRIDHQVKIRGFRIELGEIETLLRSHDSLRDAVVVAREAGPGDSRLVAYVVYHEGQDLTVSEVRRFLRRQLPDYMVPSLVVTLAAIPLTPNGKLDRSALPDPFRNAAPAAGYEPPAQGAERRLADIWQGVLQIDRVGAGDNFFELGGHSLLSLRVAAEVEKQTGWRMDPRMLFFQTLRQVAAASPGTLAGPQAGR